MKNLIKYGKHLVKKTDDTHKEPDIIISTNNDHPEPSSKLDEYLDKSEVLWKDISKKSEKWIKGWWGKKQPTKEETDNQNSQGAWNIWGKSPKTDQVQVKFSSVDND